MQYRLMTRGVLLAGAVSMAAISLPAAAPAPLPGRARRPTAATTSNSRRRTTTAVRLPGYERPERPAARLTVPTAAAARLQRLWQNNGPPPGYNQNRRAAARVRQAYGAPRGYYDANPPPPPQGYNGAPPPQDQQAQDQRYAAYAEQWAQQNCVRSHGNVAAGAIFGGIFGAVVGGIAGAATGGVAIGAGLGGVGGAAIAASANDATSPGCPPGYVVRDDAPAFYYWQARAVRLLRARRLQPVGVVAERVGVPPLSVPRVVLPALLARRRAATGTATTAITATTSALYRVGASQLTATPTSRPTAAGDGGREVADLQLAHRRGRRRRGR